MNEDRVKVVTGMCAIASMYKLDQLTDYLEEIKQKNSYKKWFFGHYHGNKNVSAGEILLWEQIIRIS